MSIGLSVHFSNIGAFSYIGAFTGGAFTGGAFTSGAFTDWSLFAVTPRRREEREEKGERGERERRERGEREEREDERREEREGERKGEREGESHNGIFLARFPIKKSRAKGRALSQLINRNLHNNIPYSLIIF